MLPKERAVECVIVGDTMNGDELIFHPTRNNRLFVLPNESDQVLDAGGDLLMAIEWMIGLRQLVEPTADWHSSRSIAAARRSSPDPGARRSRR